ncbi:hypothetical protein U472_03250 [Orenia metallireducens]|uniref:Uncharacterized protein n=1 Tax=Orenia metallireducens TaxID=1413210 RepID=A0A1C0AB71_9FIRM|nr:hypothetical protein [Orenia metallireducens]OCL27584.1 hypothetical protein U472_03250 [Orenia metallireducens]
MSKSTENNKKVLEMLRAKFSGVETDTQNIELSELNNEIEETKKELEQVTKDYQALEKEKMEEAKNHKVVKFDSRQQVKTMLLLKQSDEHSKMKKLEKKLNQLEKTKANYLQSDEVKEVLAEAKKKALVEELKKEGLI